MQLQVSRPRRRRICLDVLRCGRPRRRHRVGPRRGTHQVLLHQRFWRRRPCTSSSYGKCGATQPTGGGPASCLTAAGTSSPMDPGQLAAQVENSTTRSSSGTTTTTTTPYGSWMISTTANAHTGSFDGTKNIQGLEIHELEWEPSKTSLWENKISA